MTSWITIVWSLNAGICLALAGMQLLVWAKSRDSWPSLLFAIAAAAAAATALIELSLVRAQTPAQYVVSLANMHVTVSVLVVALVWFVRLYLSAGRLWLAWLVSGSRVVIVLLAFGVYPSSNFSNFTSLYPISFLGETVLVATGARAPFSYIGHLSGILFLVFVLDASLSAWRRGDRRRAGAVAVTFGLATVTALTLGALLNHATLPVPYNVSFPFLIILAGIAYELSLEVVRASQLTRELNESQERMRLATRSVDIGIWDWDIGNDELWVSDNIREHRGLGNFERINLERFFQWVYSDDRERVQRTVRGALESGENFEVEHRIIGASGATRWLALHGRVERASNGQPLHIRGVSADITERKLAEQALQQSAEFKQQVLSSLDHEIAILDPSGTIIDVNNAWKTFARANGDGAEWVGTNYLGVCLAAATAGDPTALGAFEGIHSVLEGTRESFEMEYLCSSPGKDRFFLMRVVPLRTSEGGVVVSHVEITQLKLAEREKEELRRDLAHMSRVSTMAQLSSALAHELNQPLGAILRNAEAGELFLQQDSPDYEELKSILADIKRDDQRAAAVIDRMRALLRRHESAHEPLSVGELLEQVIGLAHSECQARHVTAHVDVGDKLPPVRGDRVQLQQVILNLVLNALEALDGMPIDRRRLAVTARRAGERSVEVAVSDTGHGIAAGQETQLFEPFHTSKAKGLGMGLAISQMIIESHGGRIRAEPNSDGGVTFRFTLNAVESKIMP